jgi:hypothetical protein
MRMSTLRTKLNVLDRLLLLLEARFSQAGNKHQILGRIKKIK